MNLLVLVSPFSRLGGSSGPSKDIVLNQQVVLKSVDVSQEMLREYNEELAKAAEGMRELVRWGFGFRFCSRIFPNIHLYHVTLHFFHFSRHWLTIQR